MLGGVVGGDGEADWLGIDNVTGEVAGEGVIVFDGVDGFACRPGRDTAGENLDAVVDDFAVAGGLVNEDPSKVTVMLGEEEEAPGWRGHVEFPDGIDAVDDDIFVVRGAVDTEETRVAGRCQTP